VASQLNDLNFYEDYRKTARPALGSVKAFLKGNPAEAVARATGANGPAVTVVNACSSGADAIGVAMAWLRAGVCDMAIAGGTDELSRIPICGFGSLGVFSSEPCRPFDRDRQGLNLGEGAGVLILETASSARRRGFSPNLSVAGYGAACDAHHLTAPRPDGAGLEAAIRMSLTDAGIAPADVCFVNAHGTATRDNDRVEGGVLARVFGSAVKVLSAKGFTGHTLGAAGGLEAAFTALALREGWVPASLGFENQDPEIPVAALRERTVVSGRWAVSTSLAFGGNNASLVMGLCA
jgi:3-oxoacyl-(acyl-carrier-protein) synthase